MRKKYPPGTRLVRIGPNSFYVLAPGEEWPGEGKRPGLFRRAWAWLAAWLRGGKR